MSIEVAAQFFNSSYGPLVGGSVSATGYRIDGTPVALPAVTEVGGGVYKTEVSDSDAALITIVLFDAGAGSLPRYSASCVSLGEMVVVLLLNLDGSLWAGADPVLYSYESVYTGTAAPPLNVIASPYLFAVVLDSTSHLIIDAPTGSEAFTSTPVPMPLPPPPAVTPAPPAAIVVQAPTNGATQLGVDVSTSPDLPDTFMLVSGRRAVAENLYRRLLTPRGLLSFHPDIGTDVRMYMQESVTPSTIARARSDIEQEVRRDERVLDAQVACSFVNDVLEVRITVATAEGPFDMTLLVTQVTATLLFQEA